MKTDQYIYQKKFYFPSNIHEKNIERESFLNLVSQREWSLAKGINKYWKEQEQTKVQCLNSDKVKMHFFHKNKDITRGDTAPLTSMHSAFAHGHPLSEPQPVQNLRYFSVFKQNKTKQKIG